METRAVTKINITSNPFCSNAVPSPEGTVVVAGGSGVSASCRWPPGGCLLSAGTPGAVLLDDRGSRWQST